MKLRFPSVETAKAAVADKMSFLLELFKKSDANKLQELTDALAAAQETAKTAAATRKGVFMSQKSFEQKIKSAQEAVETASNNLKSAEAGNFNRKAGLGALGVVSAAVIIPILMHWAKKHGYISNDEEAERLKAELMNDSELLDDSEYETE